MNTISISEMINVFRHDKQWGQIVSKVLCKILDCFLCTATKRVFSQGLCDLRNRLPGGLLLIHQEVAGRSLAD